MTEIIDELLDSKRFCDLVGDMARTFGRRSTTADDRRRMLEPIIEIVAQKLQRNNGPEKPRLSEERKEKVLKEPSKENITLGDLGDDHGLPFDPFKENSIEEPNAVDKRLEHFEMLKAAIKNLGPVAVGQTVKFPMSMEWNAGDASVHFQALGDYSLAPDGEGIKLGGDKQGRFWQVTATKVR